MHLAKRIPDEINPVIFKVDMDKWSHFSSGSIKRNLFIHWLQQSVEDILNDSEWTRQVEKNITDIWDETINYETILRVILEGLAGQ